MRVLRIALPRRVRALRLLHGASDEPAPSRQRHQQFSGLVLKANQDATDREALLSCIGNIEHQLASIPGQVAANLEQVSALATEIGLAVAREVVGTAVEQGLVDTTAVVMRCLDQAVDDANTSQVRVQLSPDDLSTVLQRLDEHPDMRERMQQFELVPDANLPRGHVRVESGAGRLVYDPQEVLTRISDEVRKAAREEARGGAS
ncbi:MAG: FliH/SctL family protein [Planctomycetota bacterium]